MFYKVTSLKDLLQKLYFFLRYFFMELGSFTIGWYIKLALNIHLTQVLFLDDSF